MIGRTVKSWTGEQGTIVRWEPLTHGMCDVLVRHEDGREVWHGSSGLRPTDGKGNIPSRAAAREQARVEALRSLRTIRAQHVRDFRQNWPGCNFGKAILGRSIDEAIKDLSKPEDK